MRAETYGEHAENAARALNRLIREDTIPVDPDAVGQLLHCREAVIGALRQRLYAFGLDAGHHVKQLPAPSMGLNLEGIDYKLTTLLGNISFAVPNLLVEDRLSPLEMLGNASTDWVVETWRTAAVELLAASHALDTASDKPWLRDRGAGWYLVRDLAVATEAAIILDARLAEVGLLAEHNVPHFCMALEEKRLVTSQAARVATWYASTDSPDHATPGTLGGGSNVLHPVRLVSAPEDLAVAQERLAQLLRPVNAHDCFYDGGPEISADSARQLTASQLYLSRVFAEMAERSPKTQRFVDFFTERREVLRSLQPQIRYLVDMNPHEPNMRRFWQQGEITAAITRMQDQGIDTRLQPLQMLALTNATHSVTHNLGRSLRRELLRANSNLRDAHPDHEEGPKRVCRRSRIETTATDLINLHPPTGPVSQYSTPLQRAALRQTLDLTPTAARPPSPYPATTTFTASECLIV